MKKLFLPFFIIVFCMFPSCKKDTAQNDIEIYFPLKADNSWSYYVLATGDQVECTIIKTDSTVNGKSYYCMDSHDSHAHHLTSYFRRYDHSVYVLNSTGIFVACYTPYQEQLLLKEDATIGDSWNALNSDSSLCSISFVSKDSSLTVRGVTYYDILHFHRSISPMDMYYAKNIGLVKISSSGNEGLELVSYTVN